MMTISSIFFLDIESSFESYSVLSRDLLQDIFHTVVNVHDEYFVAILIPVEIETFEHTIGFSAVDAHE